MKKFLAWLFPGTFGLTPERPVRLDECICIGVTMDWSGRPTRYYMHVPTNRKFILGNDRVVNSRCYNADGWPIDPETGKKLEICE